jgi:predicted membrane protein
MLMSHLPVSTFLRRVLLADAVLSLPSGAAMALGGGLLAPWLGLPTWLLVPGGGALVAYAVLLYWMARRPSVPRVALQAFIGFNLVWAIDCVAIAAGVGFSPTPLGLAFLGMHVAAGLVFAELQFMGLRRESAARRGPRQLA